MFISKLFISFPHILELENILNTIIHSPQKTCSCSSFFLNLNLDAIIFGKTDFYIHNGVYFYCDFFFHTQKAIRQGHLYKNQCSWILLLALTPTWHTVLRRLI